MPRTSSLQFFFSHTHTKKGPKGKERREKIWEKRKKKKKKKKMKSVVVHQLSPSLPLRFLPRFNSSSSSFSNFISVKNNNNNSNPSSILSQSPNSPFKSQTRMASLSPTNQDASTHANIKDEVDVFQLIQAHQEKAARLPPVEEIRTILNHSSRGVLSTFSLKYEGYPSGSMVDFACDAYGSPLLAVSNLAVHTKDLLSNPKCSLLVAKDPEDRADLVIIVHGEAIPVSETDREAVRTAYLARHPDAFWVDFGDFQFMRIEPEVVRYVSGVATALLGSGEFTKEVFRTAKVDPVYQFSKPITSHMNKDHADETKLIVQHTTSVPVEFAYMLDIDSLGFNVKAGYQGNTFKLRIPFTRRAADRKDVKTLIVEMLQAARTKAS